jgi:hypothetical protein
MIEMPVTTSQQIARYYSQYQSVDVTFTKEVIKATHLYTKQVFIKCLGYQWPCIIYSSSMSSAKVIANLTPPLMQILKKANNALYLRFSFLQPEKTDPIAFFVSSKITGISPYSDEKPDLKFISLNYTQRPPDDLIETLGELLEANANSQKRREERVLITVDSLRKLGLTSKNTTLTVDAIPRKCIIRDLSFSGAKVIIMGVAKLLVNRAAVLRLETADRGPVNLSGTVLRFESVEGRSDIAALAIQFDEKAVPMEYKMRLNTYLKTFKVKPTGVNTEETESTEAKSVATRKSDASPAQADSTTSPQTAAPKNSPTAAGTPAEGPPTNDA